MRYSGAAESRWKFTVRGIELPSVEVISVDCRPPPGACWTYCPDWGAGATGLDTRFSHDDDTFPGRDIVSPRRGRLNPLPVPYAGPRVVTVRPYLQVDARRFATRPLPICDGGAAVPGDHLMAAVGIERLIDRLLLVAV